MYDKSFRIDPHSYWLSTTKYHSMGKVRCMIEQHLSLEEVRLIQRDKSRPQVYKFVEVRHENEYIYRFCEMDIGCPNHSQLVDLNEAASAAGLIRRTETGWNAKSSYSSSLCVGTDEAGWIRLEKALEMPITYEFEFND